MDFTQMASNFDTPRRRERAKIIAQKIQDYLGEGKVKRGMEYGCGTGLVGLRLVESFEELVLVDPSPGMIAQVNLKKQAHSFDNITSLCGNILAGLKISPAFDCIFASMALHHEPHIPLLFETLLALLDEGGRLIIVDLDKDDGSFHADEPNFTGHHGFTHDYLVEISKKAGFRAATVESFYQSEREVLHKKVPYSLFILSATKGMRPDEEERTSLRKGRANAAKVVKVSGEDIAGENGLGGRGRAR